MQGKVIAYPTDSKLLNRGQQQLVQLVAVAGITLRQNYNRRSPEAGGQDCRLRSRQAISAFAHSHLNKLKTLSAVSGAPHRANWPKYRST